MMLFGVAGNPVLHSLSPGIFHRLCLRACIEAKYARIHGGSVESVFDFCRVHQVRGINVTSPFKGAALGLCRDISAEAAATGAVNTVCFGNEIRGVNTDILALREIAGRIPASADALIIGAGDVAKSAACALAEKGIKFSVANRTEEKARILAAEFSCGMLALDEAIAVMNEFGVIISLIPGDSGIYGGFRPDEGQMLIDAAYHHTMLSGLAEKAGAVYIGGMEWLIRQALHSFRILTGTVPPAGSYDDIARYLDHESRKRPLSLALIGFMGAGKTTSGRKLAGIIGYEFLDLDDIIEESGSSIESIFFRHGESEFRDVETRALKSVAENLPSRRIVLACGGGIIEREENLELLRKFDCVVYLFSGFDCCAGRIQGGGSRPLAADLSRAFGIYASRLGRYYAACDLAYINDSDSDAAARGLAGEIERLSPS